MGTEVLYSNNFLARCERLGQLYAPESFAVGSFVGRGFADLGYELFVVLNQDRICSLLTGEVSDFDAEKIEHFFAVPLIDDLTQMLAELGHPIDSLSSFDHSSFFEIAGPTGGQSMTASTMHEALLEYGIMVCQELAGD